MRMIDINNIRNKFNEYIDKYENKDEDSFKLKIVHTMNVVQNAELISKEMNVAKEYGMDLNYITKIQKYKDKTAYKLASIEIKRYFLNAILDKKIEQFDIKGGEF